MLPWQPTAVCFLLHFPSGFPAWPLASILLFEVRTFLLLSSKRKLATAHLSLVTLKVAILGSAECNDVTLKGQALILSILNDFKVLMNNSVSKLIHSYLGPTGPH